VAARLVVGVALWGDWGMLVGNKGKIAAPQKRKNPRAAGYVQFGQFSKSGRNL